VAECSSPLSTVAWFGADATREGVIGEEEDADLIATCGIGREVV
jgi:hypothetical protein